MKIYLLLIFSLFVVVACSSNKYDVHQDKDKTTSCYEVEDEIEKLKNKDNDRAVARYEYLLILHDRKSCG